MSGPAVITVRRDIAAPRDRVFDAWLDPPHRLVFLFQGPGPEEGEWSKVAIDFADTPDGCSPTLAHEIPSEWSAHAEPVRSGWTMILDTLSRHMETNNG